MSAFQPLNVFDIRLVGDCKANGLQPAYAELHSIRGHDLGRVFADVIGQGRKTHNPGRDFSLELGFPREDHDRPDAVRRQEIQHFWHGPDVPKVLKFAKIQPL